jgi:preprotein translocase subunit YajC
MFTVLQLISAAETTSSGGNSLVGMLPLVAIFGAMYFLLLRPQRKRQKATKNLQSSLQEGDEIILSSGIYGWISTIEENYFWVEISKDTEVRVLKSMVSSRVSTPSSSSETPEEKK